MRISDWSSDVCSSDLPPAPPASGRGGLARRPDVARRKARLARFAMLGEFDARDRAFVHFVGTVGTPQRALMRIGPGQPRTEERRVGKGGVGMCSYRWAQNM